MANDDSAELIIDGQGRRVAMDITRLDPKASPATEIEGEVHDQEDLSSVHGATLKIDGAGEFKIDFVTPSRFRGSLVR
jgi:hypothetical protein